jgi:hypothetical protein
MAMQMACEFPSRSEVPLNCGDRDFMIRRR